MPPQGLEKRQNERFPSDLRLRCRGDADAIEMEAVNLSVGGAYCSTRHRLEPMTRLQVQLDLPGTSPRSTPITATAVVVRLEERPTGLPYRLALWFQKISRRDRALLRRHLGIDGH